MVKKAKVIPVIQISTTRGVGTEEDPIRPAKEYWDVDGKLLFVLDSSD